MTTETRTKLLAQELSNLVERLAAHDEMTREGESKHVALHGTVEASLPKGNGSSRPPMA